jgi:hypothetical protein
MKEFSREPLSARFEMLRIGKSVNARNLCFGKFCPILPVRDTIAKGLCGLGWLITRASFLIFGSELYYCIELMASSKGLGGHSVARSDRRCRQVETRSSPGIGKPY